MDVYLHVHHKQNLTALSLICVHMKCVILSLLPTSSLPSPHAHPSLPAPLPPPFPSPLLPPPQGVSVEAVDPVFQAKMLDMLKQTGRLVSLTKLCVCVRVCVRACVCDRLNIR